MRNKVFACLVIAMVLMVTSLASADVTEVQLPGLVRTYNASESAFIIVDLGNSDAGLYSIMLNWWGQIEAAQEYVPDGYGGLFGPICREGYFAATISALDGTWSRSWEYQAFDGYLFGGEIVNTSELNISGLARIDMTFTQIVPSAPGSPGFGRVDGASLSFDRLEELPEPSSLLALGVGLVPLVGIIRRRK